MTKETALEMIEDYCIDLGRVNWNTSHMRTCVIKGASKMIERWPADGSEKKAMRWLGYLQGVCVTSGRYTLEEVKEHSRRGYV